MEFCATKIEYYASYVRDIIINNINFIWKNIFWHRKNSTLIKVVYTPNKKAFIDWNNSMHTNIPGLHRSITGTLN